MAFVVEDGTGVADANAYITVEFADAYFSDRGISEWTGSTSVKQTAIVRATDYIELRFADRFVGQLSPDSTTLSWPRDYVYDREGNLMTNQIPLELKKSCAEYALRALSLTLLPDPEQNGISRAYNRVGPLEEEVEYHASQIIQKYPMADRLLTRYLTSSAGVIR